MILLTVAGWVNRHQQDVIAYLVEENHVLKVEGPTLADRIAQRAIPVDEALPIVKQIAEALEFDRNFIATA